MSIGGSGDRRSHPLGIVEEKRTVVLFGSRILESDLSNDLGRDLLRSNDQIAFILAILIVDQNDHSALSDRLYCCFDARDAHIHLPACSN